MIVGPCAAFSLLVVVVAPWIGSTGVTWHHVLAGISPDREIFVVARLPRTLFAAIAGGALAMAGVLFQALLRNSLADPFTLGVSAGSDWKRRFGGFPGFLSPHSRERLSPYFSCFSSREPATHYRHSPCFWQALR